VKLPPIEARYEWTRRQPLLAALLFGVIIIGPMIVAVFLLVRDSALPNTIVSTGMFAGGVLIGWAMFRRLPPWEERRTRL
jgi:hypothetical protein